MITSIIILTYDNLEYTKLCIESIRKHTKRGTYEIIIVDNNSRDGTVNWLKEQDDLRVIYNDNNMGFPKGCNQGIEIARGENILLLNNDVVVTHNWLDNLVKCLYSSKDIGAVGPVTNKCSNYQSIPISYKNLEEMREFAKKFNKSNPKKWEERLRLIGYCFLVKRRVIRKVGALDEIFTPGNCEDNDYSLRIRKAGFRLILCNDTFIHHFGSVSFKKNPKEFKDVLRINNGKFKEKWGIDVSYFKVIRKDITSIIKKTKKQKPNILHLGCGAGGTLLDMKNKIPQSNLFGIEKNGKAVISTEHFAKIDIGKEEIIRKYPKNFFDFIIINTHDKAYDRYSKTLDLALQYLKDSGYFILELPKEETRILNKQVKEIIDITKE